MKKTILLSVIIGFITFGSLPAANYVLNVDGARVTVDMGTRDSITEGASVKVFRIDTTEHPKTGQEIESRVLIERHARVLSADRDTVVILLADVQITEGMKIGLEKGEVYSTPSSDLSGLVILGEYISFSEEYTIKSGMTGYRYYFEDFGLEMGGGVVENEVSQYYYGYIGPGVSINSLALSARLLAGVNGSGTELGYGANIQFSGDDSPTIIALYNYYPPLGSYASFEIGVPVGPRFTPVLKTSWTDMTQNDGGIVFKGGMELGSVSLTVKPLAGVGVKDSDNLGLAADLTIIYSF